MFFPLASLTTLCCLARAVKAILSVDIWRTTGCQLCPTLLLFLFHRSLRYLVVMNPSLLKRISETCLGEFKLISKVRRQGTQLFLNFSIQVSNGTHGPALLPLKACANQKRSLCLPCLVPIECTQALPRIIRSWWLCGSFARDLPDTIQSSGHDIETGYIGPAESAALLYRLCNGCWISFTNSTTGRGTFVNHD